MNCGLGAPLMQEHEGQILSCGVLSPCNLYILKKAENCYNLSDSRQLLVKQIKQMVHKNYIINNRDDKFQL